MDVTLISVSSIIAPTSEGLFIKSMCNWKGYITYRCLFFVTLFMILLSYVFLFGKRNLGHAKMRNLQVFCLYWGWVRRSLMSRVITSGSGEIICEK